MASVKPGLTAMETMISSASTHKAESEPVGSSSAAAASPSTPSWPQFWVEPCAYLLRGIGPWRVFILLAVVLAYFVLRFGHIVLARIEVCLE